MKKGMGDKIYIIINENADLEIERKLAVLSENSELSDIKRASIQRLEYRTFLTGNKTEIWSEPNSSDTTISNMFSNSDYMEQVRLCSCLVY